MKTCSARARCATCFGRSTAEAVADSAHVARRLFRLEQANLLAAVAQSRNGRRLMSIPDLREDVPVCVQRDVVKLVAAMGKDGLIRAEPVEAAPWNAAGN